MRLSSALSITVIICIRQICLGYEFINYSFKKSVKDVAVHNDTIWAATTGGIVKYDAEGNILATYAESEDLPDNFITAVAVDPRDGSKWFGTRSDGVIKFDGCTWKTYDTSDGLAGNGVVSIAIDKHGVKWFATDGNAVSRYNDTSWTTYTQDDGLGGDDINDIAIDNEGYVWFAVTNGVTKYDGDSWKTYTTKDGLVDSPAKVVAVDGRNNTIWIAASRIRHGGVSRFDGKTWTSYYESEGIPYRHLSSIAIDSNGTKWFSSTYETGIVSFDGINWTKYTESDGLSCNSVFSITVDWKGRIILGTCSEGVCIFYKNNFKRFKESGGPAGDLITSIAGSDDVIWFGCKGGDINSGGLSRYDGKSWITYDTSDGLIYNGINTLAFDLDGILWIGTYHGVSRFDGTNWTTYDTSNGLASNSVRDIAVDRNGILWFGTNSGVTRYDGNSWTTFDTSDGLFGNNVYCMAIDSNGVKWFGGWSLSNECLSSYDGKMWKTYSKSDGFIDNSVSCIYVGSNGNRWFGTSNGISMLEASSVGIHHNVKETGDVSGITMKITHKESYLQVKYSLATSSCVSMSLYTFRGRCIAKITRMQKAGMHSYTFPTSEIANGAYIVHFAADDLETSSVILMAR